MCGVIFAAFLGPLTTTNTLTGRYTSLFKAHPQKSIGRWKMVEWMSGFENVMIKDHGGGLSIKLGSIKKMMKRNISCSI